MDGQDGRDEELTLAKLAKGAKRGGKRRGANEELRIRNKELKGTETNRDRDRDRLEREDEGTLAKHAN